MFEVVAEYFMEFVNDNNRNEVVELYKKFCGTYNERWYARRQAKRLFDQLIKLVDESKPGFTMYYRGGSHGNYAIDATWDIVGENNKVFTNTTHMAHVNVIEV